MPVIKHNPEGVFPPLRIKYLGDHQPSLTVVCCQLLEPEWKLEVEATAAK